MSAVECVPQPHGDAHPAISLGHECARSFPQAILVWLVRCAGHVGLGRHQPGLVIEGGQKMHGAVLGQATAAA
ncbi:hypothetical protein ACIBG4_06605 [Nonomuraea sp. NPDC050383]|uniref:hypothetical protein n=1 Tax=Nonomuraea sp. NPDC050383 TaxID=3364362 RepID=UPI00379B6E22